MPTRREFVQTGMAAAVLAPFPAAAAAFASPQLYKFIFDEHFPASVRVAQRAAHSGVAIHGIRGDVTGLWYHDLYFAWKKGPVPIAGITRADSLFCLEILARDAGLRLKSRVEDGPLVSWVIGPK